MVHHDLPGFQFDATKNRYYYMPNEKRARESNRYESDPCPSSQNEPPSKRHGADVDSSTISNPKDGLPGLIHRREIDGHGRSSNPWQNAQAFQGKYLELNASHFRVWEYDKHKHWADGGIEQLRVNCQTDDGEVEEDVLFVGGSNGRLGIWQITDSEGDEADSHVHKAKPCLPRDPASWAGNEKDPPFLQPSMRAIGFPSGITSIKRLNEWSGQDESNNGNLVHQRVAISTIGNGLSGGAVYIVSPSQSHSNNPWPECLCSHPFRLSLVVTTNQSIWTAETNPRGGSACIGLNSGVALVDLEKRALSWVCHTSSDAISQQFDSSGNIVFSGYRNGLVSTFDIRLPHPDAVRSDESNGFEPLHLHHGPGPLARKRRPSRGKQRVKNSENLDNFFSHAPLMKMKSTVCSIRLFRTNEWYLLASALNGDIEQWDRRFVGRGSVRSYEGHCNSHTYLHLGTDPTERLLVSGGEDRAIRIWSLASGKLLHVESGLTSAATTVSWPTSARYANSKGSGGVWEEPPIHGEHPWDFWMGSKSGLLHVRGSAR